MKNSDTILKTVTSNLCMGCGTCISICPKNALKLIENETRGIYLPQLNSELCVNCKLCLKICPGLEVDFKKLKNKKFGTSSGDVQLGFFQNCYVGYSENKDIRYNSSSGGFITQLLIYMLEEGLIDGAIVTRMNKKNPLKPEPFIARNREEIIEASKSKYCPVPLNLTLKTLLNSNPNERFAYVGLPCHIHGLRKAQDINIQLEKAIILTIGIFCNHSPTFKATDFYLSTMNIKKDNIARMEFRGYGWPGIMKILMNDGTEICKNIHEYWMGGFGTYFFNIRCTLCCDFTAELSDISCADAWLPEYLNDSIGRSIIVSRTINSSKVMDEMKKKNIFFNEEIGKEKIQLSQGHYISNRKKMNCRFRILKALKYQIPDYNTELNE